MRYYVIMLLVVMMSAQSNGQSRNLDSYDVYEIETIDDYFIIYAKNGEKKYKIVSMKEEDEKCNRIQVNKRYEFDLYAQSSVPLITGEIIAPVSYYDQVCHVLAKGTKLCTDGKNGIYDLYFAHNVKGICVEAKAPSSEGKSGVFNFVNEILFSTLAKHQSIEYE